MKHGLLSFEEWIKMSPTSNYNAYVDLFDEAQAMEEHIEDFHSKEDK